MGWPAAVAVLCLAAPLCAGGLRVGTFRADASPEPGEPNIWITPAAKIEDPLWIKGVVLDDGSSRYVLAALDWCGVGGSTHRLFRAKIAEAAGTDISRVVVQSVHQHTAPYIVGDAYTLLEGLPSPPLRMSDGYLARLTSRLAAAVRKAAGEMQPFDRVGTSRVKVERVASARRVFAEGKLHTRYSSGAKDPAMAALPEGDIDPYLRTITLAQGDRPLARLHFYATHPQTFCCDGRVTADFVGRAREERERAEGVFQVYFTGCSGDVTVGKYNDGAPEAREALATRLERALAAAAGATRFEPAGSLLWRHVPLKLESKPAPPLEGLTGQNAYRTAVAAAFAARTTPLDTASLAIGRVSMLFLPGEPVLDFQKYAQETGRGRFVAVAGYGDIAPGYLVTDRDYTEGGYEPSASHAAPGTEARVLEAIRQLLGREAP